MNNLGNSNLFPVVWLPVLAVMLAACSDASSDAASRYNSATVKTYEDCSLVGTDAQAVINQGYQPKAFVPSPPTGVNTGDFIHSGEWRCTWEYRDEIDFGTANGCSFDVGCTSIATERLEIRHFSGLFDSEILRYPLDDQGRPTGTRHPITRNDVLVHLQQDDPRHGPRRYEIIESPLLENAGYDNVVIVRAYNEDADRMASLDQAHNLGYWEYHMLVLWPAPPFHISGTDDPVFVGHGRVTLGQEHRWDVFAASGYYSELALVFRPTPSPPVDHDTVVAAFLEMLEPWKPGDISDIEPAMERFQEQMADSLQELEAMRDQAEEALRAIE